MQQTFIVPFTLIRLVGRMKIQLNGYIYTYLHILISIPSSIIFVCLIRFVGIKILKIIVQMYVQRKLIGNNVIEITFKTNHGYDALHFPHMASTSMKFNICLEPQILNFPGQCVTLDNTTYDIKMNKYMSNILNRYT